MPRLWLILSVLVLVAAIGFACDKGDDDDDDNHGDDDDDDTADDDTASQCGDPILDQYAAYCPEDANPCAATAYVYNDDLNEDWHAKRDLPVGAVEAKMFKFEAPFHITKIKLKFKEGTGQARIHLYADLLGSVPKYVPWSDLISTDEFMEPITIDVTAEGWMDVDVSDRNLMFLPGTRVWVAYEHLSDDGLPLLYYSKETDDYMFSRYYEEDYFSETGFRWAVVGYKYMIRLEGNSFCERDGAPTFTNITTEAGINVTGQHRTGWTDYDGDGDLDIVLTRLSTSDPKNVVIYRNNGDGTFTDATAETGLDGIEYTAMTVFADYDNDGDQDCFSIVQVDASGDDDDDTADDDTADDDTADDDTVDRAPKADNGARNSIWLNDGTGHFTKVPTSGLEAAVGFSAVGFGDYDNDGLLDIYIGAWLVEYPYPNSYPDYLYHNNGDGTFTDVSEASGIRGEDDPKPCYGVTWIDYNEDGWYDIFVSNYGRESNYLLENQGDGTFIDVASQKKVARPADSGTGNTFGADFGDLNNDGYFDLMMTDIAHPRYQPGSGPSSINLNDGPPDYGFTWVNDTMGFHPDEGDVDPSFIDFNNDGKLDVFISSLYTGHFSRMYEQVDDGSLLDTTYWTGVEQHDATGNAWADFDGDGDMDLLSAYRSPGGGVQFMRNDQATGSHWLEVTLVGTTANRDAIGAKITVIAGDLTQVRYVQGARGHYGAQPMMTQHFGLGPEGVVDSVQVRWPGGATETWTGVSADQIAVLTEGESNAMMK